MKIADFPVLQCIHHSETKSKCFYCSVVGRTVFPQLFWYESTGFRLMAPDCSVFILYPVAFYVFQALVDYHLWKYLKLFGLAICCKHIRTQRTPVSDGQLFSSGWILFWLECKLNHKNYNYYYSNVIHGIHDHSSFRKMKYCVVFNVT